MNSFKNGTKPIKNPWHNNRQNKSSESGSKIGVIKSELKFKQAQEKLQAAVKKHVKDYDSSSEEEELEASNIIKSILKSYDEFEISQKNLNRTHKLLGDSCISGATSCLICISTVKRNEAIWNCINCYCIFHLTCIQRWSKDTVVQQKQALEEPLIVTYNKKITWGCPNCRFDYQPTDIPTTYTCFCKKRVNPEFQPFLAPHSCGETCGKDLKPNCGHNCVLLCHPGPCPPCPKTTTEPCYCGNQPPRIQRCSNKYWSCGSPCSKKLSCQKHTCSQVCHYGDCLPCSKKSIQKCVCGANSKLGNCSEPLWQCDKVCNQPLECGFHNCSEICHTGKCDTCPLSKPRTCSCGKSKYDLPCTEDTPTCGDTCGKLLECGIHTCNYRCHKDSCGPCLEIVTKICRCEMHKKEVQCRKVYLCETKCKEIKDCNKHPCNRKCCDKNCPPCEKPCGRTLGCGNHKCTSICHRGPCYPCVAKESVFCKCGKTSIEVPCGRKQKTKPPKCNKLCENLPDCHHEKRVEHRCHFGDCPPCKQVCNKERLNCDHKCPSVCHSAVLVKIEGEKPSMPWERTTPQLELQCLPCPNCVFPVPVTCLGKHETLDWPCHLAKISSCGRICERLLTCGNHKCSLMCHHVEGEVDELLAGNNCEQCQKPCEKLRLEGCSHVCPKPCHPGDCPPCKQMIRLKCHCGLNQPYVLCNKWTSNENKEEIQSCGDQCPKNYDCGHRCRSNCHSGKCITTDPCKKRVKVFCNCKRLKKEFSCDAVRSATVSVECDENCLKKQRHEEKLKEEEIKFKKINEDLKNKAELEKFEKKFHGKKKHKPKRVTDDFQNISLLKKYWFFILSTILGIVSISLMFFIFQ